MKEPITELPRLQPEPVPMADLAATQEEKVAPEAGTAAVATGEDVLSQHIQAMGSRIDDSIGAAEIRLSIDADSGDGHFQSFISELPNKDGFIDFSQFQRVGHGGTHDVFIYPRNPSFVIKLNRGALEKALSVGQSELPPEMRRVAEQYTDSANGNNEELYKYFGQQHCLREKASIQKINVEHGGVIRNIEGIITIQEASDVFKDPTKKDYSTGYAEQNPAQNPALHEYKEAYDRMNRALLSNEEFSESDVLTFNDKLKSIFDLVDQDTDFANSMREFLLRFKKYFEASGKFIDLVGQENIIFHQKNGQWTFQIGSVTKGENKQVMEQALSMLEESPETLNQNQKIKNQLMNQLALIRLLNATGLKVGIGKIIDVQLSEKQFTNIDKINFATIVGADGFEPSTPAL